MPSGPPHPANPLESPAFVADPYPFYAMLRASNPVLKLPLPFPQLDAGAGVYVLTRFADVERVLRARRVSADRLRADVVRRLRDRLPSTFIGAEDGPRSMLQMDGADQLRVRLAVNQAFTPRRVAGLSERIRGCVERLLDEAEARGGLELMRDLAGPLPALTIAELLGLPPAHHRRFSRWSAQQAEMRPGPDSESDLEEMLDYLRAALAQGPPAGSLLAGLVGARRCGVLGEDELLSNAMLLLIAGLETTTHFLGNAMVALLSHRDQWELLLERPDLLPPAIEELLRFDNSVQVALRVPCEALPVSGAVLPKGALVVCVIGAANRDPEMFERPDALWIERPCVRHLSFGFGAHFCLGAELARLEARQALGALLRRFPRLRLEGAVRFRPNPIMRGPLSLSVAP